MKYKVGDKVIIKSLDWYNENRDKTNEIECGSVHFIPDMAVFCNKIVTISSVWSDTLEIYHIKEDSGIYNWTNEMIEGLAEEETKPNIIEEAKTYWDSIKDAWICPQGYQFVDENGNVINATKIILEKQKNKYPKTYEECCNVLGYNQVMPKDHILGYMGSLLSNFQQLLICRDAYWKIAGEEMGLGKPWKYDCNSEYFTPAIIYKSDFIQKVEIHHRNAILTFPTEEMRDAFYESFKELIESCKKLL